MAKPHLYGDDPAAKKTTQSVLCYVLDQTLRLLHPVMPFITEEIWQHLPHEGTSITIAEWPKVNEAHHYPESVKQMALLMDVIRNVRNIRAEMNVPLSKKIELMIKPTSDEAQELLEKGEEYIRRFCNPEKLEISSGLNVPEKVVSAVVTGAEIFLPLAGLIDLDKEIARLEKEAENLAKEVDRVSKKLSNQGFIAKAPAQVVEEERAKGQDYQEKLNKVKERIEELKS